LDTLPGLQSSGVTLEFAAIWDMSNPAAAPPASGTLCSLRVSQPTRITVAPNRSRGGVLGASDLPVQTAFLGAEVGPRILGFELTPEKNLHLRFMGGELESATSLDGIWTATGVVDGDYTETATDGPRFFRVRARN
jgi:hypothetical protein